MCDRFFAANADVFPLVLVGLFVLASGITILQVAANPLVAALGNPAYSHFRLTFSQTFNSLATFIAPILGAHLFLKGVEVKEGTVITPEVRAHALGGINTAYLWLCGIIAVLTPSCSCRARRRVRRLVTRHAGAGNRSAR